MSVCDEDDKHRLMKIDTGRYRRKGIDGVRRWYVSLGHIDDYSDLKIRKKYQ